MSPRFPKLHSVKLNLALNIQDKIIGRTNWDLIFKTILVMYLSIIVPVPRLFLLSNLPEFLAVLSICLRIVTAIMAKKWWPKLQLEPKIFPSVHGRLKAICYYKFHQFALSHKKFHIVDIYRSFILKQFSTVH